MVDLTYVKKKRRRKIAGAVTTISGALIIPFLIIPFIGKSIGYFTIGLKNNGVSLTMDTDMEFSNPRTFMGIERQPGYSIYSVGGINRNYKDEVIDNPSSNDEIGQRINPETKEVTALYFFKYTFFVKNTGTTKATYDIKLSIIENQKPTNVSYSLDDLLRVRWYENDALSDTHSYETYAKKSTTPNFDEKDENPFYNTCIGSNSDGICEDGYAELFNDDGAIIKSRVSGFAGGDIKRYTVVFWLEGSDPECIGTTPNQTNLKLAINIEAFEEKDEK